MLILKIQGRLGNQMFQYAFTKSLQKKYYEKEKIIINYSKSKFSNTCVFCKNNPFNFKDLESTYKLNLNIIQIFVFYMYTLLKIITKKEFDLKFQPFLNKFGIYYLQDDGYCEFNKSKFKNKLIYGYFGSEKFFENVKDEILEDFELHIPLSIKNQNFLEKIKKSNSIAVTVRRGDYLNNDLSKFFLVCEQAYYEKAIQISNKEIKNGRFVVFSDDIDWAKQSIKFPVGGGILYEDKNNSAIETLYLMQNCKHFIISNSTFHWWAQYLSHNNNKKVYAPSIWNNERTSVNIYMKNWTLIDIDECRRN